MVRLKGCKYREQKVTSTAKSKNLKTVLYLEITAVEPLNLQIEALRLSAWQKDPVSIGKQGGIADSREPIDGRENTPVATSVSILVFLSLLVSLYSLKQSILPTYDDKNLRNLETFYR